MSQELHNWQGTKHYVGKYADPATETSYTTSMHDVRCEKCGEIVSLPDSMMPPPQGCPGIVTHVKRTDEPPQMFKDEQPPKREQHTRHGIRAL